MRRADYTGAELEAALAACGVVPGAVVFCHSNIGYFGRPEGASGGPAVCDLVIASFRNLLGRTGTLVVPTFSYSFGSDKNDRRFDPATSPSVCGMLSEYTRKLPDARRSLDPMFSVAGLGARAQELTAGLCTECFGEDSFWRRFLDAGGIFANLNLDAGSTFIHFVERRLGVSYRENRTFAGALVLDGVEQHHELVYFSRRLDDPDSSPAFERFDRLARAGGLVRSAPVGRGAVVGLSAADTVRLIADTLPREPRLLTKAGA